jgi:hypothetical protein
LADGLSQGARPGFGRCGQQQGKVPIVVLSNQVEGPNSSDDQLRQTSQNRGAATHTPFTEQNERERLTGPIRALALVVQSCAHLIGL